MSIVACVLIGAAVAWVVTITFWVLLNTRDIDKLMKGKDNDNIW